MHDENKPIENVELPDYTADWYTGLSEKMKRKVFMEALYKMPYLSNHMKFNNIKASDPDFVKHYSFKLMVDVLRNT